MGSAEFQCGEAPHSPRLPWLCTPATNPQHLQALRQFRVGHLYVALALQCLGIFGI